MKFRWRGGTTGFFGRRMGKGIARSVPDDQLGSCFVILFILAILVGSPILIPLFLVMIVPLVLLGLLVVISVKVLSFMAKNHSIEKAMSWFFLKEDEPDGTVLPFGEIKNRVKEYLAP